jgi:hypothetical protein
LMRMWQRCRTSCKLHPPQRNSQKMQSAPFAPPRRNSAGHLFIVSIRRPRAFAQDKRSHCLSLFPASARTTRLRRCAFTIVMSIKQNAGCRWRCNATRTTIAPRFPETTPILFIHCSTTSNSFVQTSQHGSILRSTRPSRTNPIMQFQRGVSSLD